MRVVLSSVPIALALTLMACEPRDAEHVEPEPSAATRHDRTPAPSEPAPAPEAAARHRATVVLVPLRSFPDDLLVATETALRAELGVDVVRHATIELPEAAYYPPRRRYRADALLDALESIADDYSPDTKILGLTEVDISTSKPPHEDWGIFGLGRSPGRTAVLSSKRLSRRPRNREHVRFRVATTAVHEIGHTFGLPHCTEFAAHCVMLDAEGGIENTDASTGKLGPACAAKLDRLAPMN